MNISHPVIDACSFGKMVINHRTYTSDLIIYPDGRVVDSWWREKGHRLSSSDISQLILSEPEVIVAGTGISGMMKPETGLENLLNQKGIQFHSGPNHEAVELYMKLSSKKKKIGACFHLTC